MGAFCDGGVSCTIMGHCDLKLDLKQVFKIVMLGAYLIYLFVVEIPNMVCECILDGGVPRLIFGSP